MSTVYQWPWRYQIKNENQTCSKIQRYPLAFVGSRFTVYDVQYILYCIFDFCVSLELKLWIDNFNWNCRCLVSRTLKEVLQDFSLILRVGFERFMVLNFCWTPENNSDTRLCLNKLSSFVLVYFEISQKLLIRNGLAGF